MVQYEDFCVDCPQGCINCGRKHTKVLYCDECKQESQELYEYEGQELCEECLLEIIPKV